MKNYSDISFLLMPDLNVTHSFSREGARGWVKMLKTSIYLIYCLQSLS